GDGPPWQAGRPVPLNGLDRQPFGRIGAPLVKGPAVSTAPALSADVWLLFTTRSVRLFAYGFLSVILVLYLAEVGLSDPEVGLLLTMTLIGDTGVSLGIIT